MKTQRFAFCFPQWERALIGRSPLVQCSLAVRLALLFASELRNARPFWCPLFVWLVFQQCSDPTCPVECIISDVVFRVYTGRGLALPHLKQTSGKPHLLTMLLLACTIMFGSDRTSLLNSSGRFFFFLSSRRKLRALVTRNREIKNSGLKAKIMKT